MASPWVRGGRRRHDLPVATGAGKGAGGGAGHSDRVRRGSSESGGGFDRRGPAVAVLGDSIGGCRQPTWWPQHPHRAPRSREAVDHHAPCPARVRHCDPRPGKGTHETLQRVPTANAMRGRLCAVSAVHADPAWLDKGDGHRGPVRRAGPRAGSGSARRTTGVARFAAANSRPVAAPALCATAR